MMGKIVSGRSFGQCLAYCLSDKKLKPGKPSSEDQGSPDQQPSEDQSLDHHPPVHHHPDHRRPDHRRSDDHPGQCPLDHPHPPDRHHSGPPDDVEVAFKDRAEILHYNQCYGNRQELTAQFNEVSRLNPNMSKPVMRITLSLPSGERLTKATLIRIGNDCAKAIGFAANQYVTILHKDTDNQHLHMIVNRVGFNGSTVTDSYSKGMIADFCRDAERKHGLRREPGPRRYRQGEEQSAPRQGVRLDRLKNEIRQALLSSPDYPAFQRAMEQQGYAVYRQSLGIAFMDKDNVPIKGSEAGYPLKLIEHTLARDMELRKWEEQKKLAEEQRVAFGKEQRKVHKRGMHR